MSQTLEVPEMLPAPFTPLMKRHFIFAIEGVDAFLVKTAARPELTTEEVTINWLNSTRYIAGKTTFGTLSVTLHDPIAPSGAQQVMEWARLCFDSVSGRGGYPDFYKRDIQIKMLDPVGTVVQLWDIKGAFCTTMGFGDLSYDSTADMAEISLTIRFDNMAMQY